MFFNSYLFLGILLPFLQSITATVPSPVATADLICHTSQDTDCYPRLFQPTDDFQIIRDDQDLPPGLHIRLNLETGKKEAKINVIREDDNLTWTKAVVMVDAPETPDAESPSSLDHQQKLLKPVESAPFRPTTYNSEDGKSFLTNVDIVKSASSVEPEAKVLLPALETLEDISHDIYWGLAIAKDSSTVLKLVDLLSGPGLLDARVKGAAALVFGTAIRNNPAAFTAALAHFYNDEIPTGPLEAVILALLHEQLPQLLARYVYVLSALCQDETYFWKFVNQGGLETLELVFDFQNAGEDGRDRLRGKIANFLLDHFLQEDAFRMIEDGIAPGKGAESILEPEDPWTMFEDDDEVSQSPPGIAVTGSYKSMVSKLQPWCSILSRTLARWEEKNGQLGRTGAQENVQEAYSSLQHRMVQLGSCCEDGCAKP